jgi:hypothetical protein
MLPRHQTLPTQSVSMDLESAEASDLAVFRLLFWKEISAWEL